MLFGYNGFNKGFDSNIKQSLHFCSNASASLLEELVEN